MKSCLNCKHCYVDDEFGAECRENRISTRYNEIGERINGCGNLYHARSSKGFCGPEAKCFDPIKFYRLPFGFETAHPIAMWICIAGIIGIPTILILG